MQLHKSSVAIHGQIATTESARIRGHSMSPRGQEWDENVFHSKALENSGFQPSMHESFKTIETNTKSQNLR